VTNTRCRGPDAGRDGVRVAAPCRDGTDRCQQVGVMAESCRCGPIPCGA
jgi:hypothetical protein